MSGYDFPCVMCTAHNVMHLVQRHQWMYIIPHKVDAFTLVIEVMCV